MKEILIALMVGIMWLPLPAAAQKWIDPYTKSDGAQVGGHWATPQDRWTREYDKPGTINPFTGHFNRYGRQRFEEDSQPSRGSQSPLVVPGSSAPNPYAIPGSSGPNSYAIPGSSSRKLKTQ
jgi:hypothetical protein